MDSEGLSSAPRELLNRLIREGEIFDDVLYEFGRTGETKRRVSLVEIRQWYEESRKLADSLGRTLPDPAGAFALQINWEGIAASALRRVLRGLKVIADEDLATPGSGLDRDSTVSVPRVEKVDVLIVTALHEEFSPLPELFQAKPIPKAADHVVRYHQALLKTTHGQEYTVCLFTLGHKGPASAAGLLDRAVRLWKPDYLIVAGFAAVIPGGGRKVGDLLVADSILDVSEFKRWPRKDELRGKGHPCDFTLVHDVEHFRPRSRRRVHVGVIMSQTDLVKSAKHRDGLARLVRQALGTGPIGLEMEGGGVIVAAKIQPAASRFGFIMIKGAVDFANYHKDDDARKKAARTVGKFIYSLLKQGPIGKEISKH